MKPKRRASHIHHVAQRLLKRAMPGAPIFAESGGATSPEYERLVAMVKMLLRLIRKARNERDFARNRYKPPVGRPHDDSPKLLHWSK
jgi:hypothetical protein